MSDITGSKTCAGCGVDKVLTEYHRNSARADGRQNKCKDCDRQEKADFKARFIEEHGIDEWRRRTAERVKRSRAKNGSAYERHYAKARSMALRRLVDAHRDEFDRFMAEARETVGI